MSNDENPNDLSLTVGVKTELSQSEEQAGSNRACNSSPAVMKTDRDDDTLNILPEKFSVAVLHEDSPHQFCLLEPTKNVTIGRKKMVKVQDSSFESMVVSIHESRNEAEMIMHSLASGTNYYAERNKFLTDWSSIRNKLNIVDTLSTDMQTEDEPDAVLDFTTVSSVSFLPPDLSLQFTSVNSVDKPPRLLRFQQSSQALDIINEASASNTQPINSNVEAKLPKLERKSDAQPRFAGRKSKSEMEKPTVVGRALPSSEAIGEELSRIQRTRNGKTSDVYAFFRYLIDYVFEEHVTNLEEILCPNKLKEIRGKVMEMFPMNDPEEVGRRYTTFTHILQNMRRKNTRRTGSNVTVPKLERNVDHSSTAAKTDDEEGGANQEDVQVPSSSAKPRVGNTPEPASTVSDDDVMKSPPAKKLRSQLSPVVSGDKAMNDAEDVQEGSPAQETACAAVTRRKKTSAMKTTPKVFEKNKAVHCSADSSSGEDEAGADHVKRMTGVPPMRSRRSLVRQIDNGTGSSSTVNHVSQIDTKPKIRQGRKPKNEKAPARARSSDSTITVDCSEDEEQNEVVVVEENISDEIICLD